MGEGRIPRSGLFRALAAIALLAAGLRAIVPAGYMLAAEDEGRFLAIVLCTGHGPAEAVLDLATGDLVDPEKADEHDAPSGADGEPCVFAASAQLTTPEATSALGAPIGPEVALARAPVLRPGAGLAAPPPWATGPPHSV